MGINEQSVIRAPTTNVRGTKTLKVKTLSDAEVAQYPDGPPVINNGMFLGTGQVGTPMYFMDNGTKRSIPDPDTFVCLNRGSRDMQGFNVAGRLDPQLIKTIPQ